MINISKLLSRGGARFPGDRLRYSREGRRFPVVVWHMTGRCNLACRHCYAGGESASQETRMPQPDELDFLRLISKLGAPALILSGGEPMLHPGFFSLMAAAHGLGLNVTVSTNGTMIDGAAAKLMSAGASYAGVSVDGPSGFHDGFRGLRGAFDAAISAVELLAAAGCRAGLRVTLAAPVIEHLAEIFRIAENLPISRICFYHFIASGRGAEDKSLVPGRDDEDAAVRKIIEWADERQGGPDWRAEVLTVGRSADSVTLYEYLKSRSDCRTAAASELMKTAAANPTGSGILSVRWDGSVFRNQFMWGERLGEWRDIERAAELAASSRKLADECAACAWKLKICGGRIDGFGGRCDIN